MLGTVNCSISFRKKKKWFEFLYFNFSLKRPFVFFLFEFRTKSFTKDQNFSELVSYEIFFQPMFNVSEFLLLWDWWLQQATS